MLKLTTERLLIIPCSLHIAKAVILDSTYLQTFLRVEVPEGWPANELRAYLPYYIEALERDPALLGWGVWILIEENLKTVIGDAGFKGRPDEDGMIELGYSIHPDYRNQGYASEAAEALVDWAFICHDEVRVIHAECSKENLPSMRVLQKLGMQCLRDSGSVLEWELKRS